MSQRTQTGLLLAVVAAIVVSLVILRMGNSAKPVRQVEDSATKSAGATSTAVIVKPELPASDYAGSAACRACHESIWDRYQTHPMANSASTVEESTAIEDFTQQPSFTVPTALGGVEYRVEKNADGVFHHESLTDPELGAVYDQRVRMDYSIGSGRHGRSYIFAEGDCLYMSPITWYTDKSNWHLSPNYQAGKNLRFERRIVLACLVCHSERVAVNREEPNRFKSPVFVESKIGCESCHGPGTKHVAFREGQRSSELNHVSSDPIVNPAKLDPERRESVCWQCHMAAEERFPRYGKLDSDFRPGDRFDDVWIAFVRELRVDETGSPRVASHVEQTRASACYQRSEGRFGCMSCHDPHSTPPQDRKDEYYREKCLNCHSERGCSLPQVERMATTPSNSCISCHMPSQSLHRTPHSSRTDHRIERGSKHDAPSRSDLPLSIFNPGHRKLPQAEEDRAWGLLLAKAAYLQSNAQLAQTASERLLAAAPSMPEDGLLLEWLGVCEQLTQKPESARGRWLKILERNPEDEGALHRLADLQLSQKDLQQSKRALVRYLNLVPWQSGYQLRLAAILADLGSFDEAARTCHESLRINPTQAAPHQILEEICRRQGKQEDAAIHRRVAQRLRR